MHGLKYGPCRIRKRDYQVSHKWQCSMSKCVDITGVVAGNIFHDGSCGLGENNCAEYPRGLVSSRLSGESSDSLSGIAAGGDRR